MKALTLISSLLLVVTIAPAQEQLGLRLGNYAGITSLQLNPSWQVNGPLKWDVNLVAGGVFTHQDYLYGQRGSMLKLFTTGGEVITADDPTGADGSQEVNGVPFYFQTNRNYDLQQSSFGMAPSFLFNLREHSFGAAFSARTFVSGYQLDGDLGYYNVSDTNIYVGQIDPMQIGAMSWAEAGFTYARTVSTGRAVEVNAGGTLKFLVGFDALSIRNLTSTDVYRADDEIALGPADLQMAYATGYDGDNGYSLRRNGFGMAADLGVTWIRPETGRSDKPYRWKVGVSLLDVGRVRYRRDASVYRFTSADSSYFAGAPFEEIRDPDDLIDAINNSGNSASAELTGESFGMWTPMALSVQFDAPVIRKLYVSGTAVIGMHFRGDAVERSDLLAVTPRLEHRWLELGIPVSLYRWKELHLGTYVRLGPLTIGTETLNSWFIPGRLEGSDIYFSLKIHSGMFKKAARDVRGSGCYSSLY